MGKLVLVPTPLGNLGDVTLRAMEVLRGAEIVLAEDTRTSGKLLKLLDIPAPLRAFHMQMSTAFWTAPCMISPSVQGSPP